MLAYRPWTSARRAASRTRAAKAHTAAHRLLYARLKRVPYKSTQGLTPVPLGAWAWRKATAYHCYYH